MKSMQTRETTFHNSPIVPSFLSQNYDNLSKSSSPFTDEFFPPEDNSLYSTKSALASYQIPSLPSFLPKIKKNFYLNMQCVIKEITHGNVFQKYTI